MRILITAGLFALGAAATAEEPEAVADQFEDPYLWLEEVEGEAALDWVRGNNARTLDHLRADPRYDRFEAEALKIVTSDDRIPYGAVRRGEVFNFWQDDAHVRGIWRRTSLDSYRAEAPDWETVLDVDALAEAEDANWVFKGANCHYTGGDPRTSCLVSLSDGGKDAVVQREYDIAAGAFVPGGFETPEAKQGAVWASHDALLISTDWNGDGSTLTTSGYPYIVKRWIRGQALNEAQTVLLGEPDDVGVWPMAIEADDGRLFLGAVQANTFFTSTYWHFPQDGGGPVKWPIPPKSNPSGVYQGQVLVSLQQDWTPQGQDETFRSGDLVAFDLEAFLDTYQLPPVELVFRPGDRQAINGVSITQGGTLISINDNVAGKILRLARGDAGWRTEALGLPPSGRAGVVFADPKEPTVFLNYEGFLTPDTLFAHETATGGTASLKRAPAKFEADGLVVEQFEAASSDGTQVPYFVVRRADTELTGETPTLLYGYGGFQISLNPSYSPIIGKLWLEEGGAYVLANIRGGGEFGPAWHQAGLKTERQIVYDDFIAIAEDLIARGLTSPRRLGIMGGSNGGLLMGVMLNQRPDLWNAVVIQVPLLDMLRYHLLLAGASWVDEYGSPEVAEERAFLETISPYHNFDPAKPYPAPFFVTSTKDDRVHPGHARKLARLFEDAGLPFYYYENIDGGHSAAANQTERAKRTALEFTYLAERLFP